VKGVRRHGNRRYEISDHLGNIRAVITDRRFSYPTGDSVELLSETAYWPFGMPLWSKEKGKEGYLYGFQGQETEDEVRGEGNLVSYKYRMHDPRLGRFFSVDPMVDSLPWQSPCTTMDNNPILLTDPTGECTECPECPGKGTKEDPKRLSELTVTAQRNPEGQNASSQTSSESPSDLHAVDKFDQFIRNANSGQIGKIICSTCPYSSDLKNYVMEKRVRDKSPTSRFYSQLFLFIVYSGMTTPMMGASPSIVSPSFYTTLNVANTTIDAVNTTLNVAKTSTSLADDAIRLTTSSKSIAPSRTYTIYDGTGQLYKFGVTDAKLSRYYQSLKQAGPGAYGTYSSVMPKN